MPIVSVVSVIPGVAGDKAVLRRLKFDDFKASIDALGMEQGQRGQFRDAIHQSRGLVLLTGPTRSGKNTTIYAALAEFNHTERNIATAELVDRGHLPGVHHTTTNDAVGYTFACAMMWT